MKNSLSVLVLVLLAMLVALLWRIERHLAPMADLAAAQISDRVAARQTEQTRLAAEVAARAEATRKEQIAAQEQLVTAAAAQQREREELARRARLETPVKPGEVVDEIVLDNHATVRGAVVVAVQASSVSFKAGARLYNIPTEQLPEELQARVRTMFPTAPHLVLKPAVEPAIPPEPAGH